MIWTRRFAFLLAWAALSGCDSKGLPGRNAPEDGAPAPGRTDAFVEPRSPGPPTEVTLAIPADPAPSDVSLEGGRFIRNGAPFFPVGNFLTARDATGPHTHVYLSEKLTDEDRRRILEEAVAADYNVLSIYTYNEHDYDSEPVSPFVGPGFGGAFAEDRLSVWRARLEAVVAAGLHPILWLVPDDSPGIHAAEDAALESYIDDIVSRFDHLPVFYILALEADEYWPDDKVDRLGAFLASRTNRPVGIHQLEGESHLMTRDWVDFAAYQYGFGKSWRQIFDATIRVMTKTQKPVFAMEYDLQGGLEDERLGLAAAFAGAVGVGNGAPSGLARFMEQVPPGANRSRTRHEARLQGPSAQAVADFRTLNVRWVREES